MSLIDLRGKEMHVGNQPVNEVLLGTTSIMKFVEEPIFPMNTLHESSPSGLIVDNAYRVTASVPGYTNGRFGTIGLVQQAYVFTIDGVKCFRVYDPITARHFDGPNDEPLAFSNCHMFQNLTSAMAGHTTNGNYKLRYKGRTRAENNTINVSTTSTPGVPMLFTPEWKTYESETFSLYTHNPRFDFRVRGEKPWHLTIAPAPLFKDIELIKV